MGEGKDQRGRETCAAHATEVGKEAVDGVWAADLDQRQSHLKCEMRGPFLVLPGCHLRVFMPCVRAC